MKLEYQNTHVHEPIELPDCNNCIWISQTEEEQKKNKGPLCHFCTKYDRRLFHRISSLVHDYHDPYIWPCRACDEDGHVNYQERKGE